MTPKAGGVTGMFLFSLLLSFTNGSSFRAFFKSSSHTTKAANTVTKPSMLSAERCLSNVSNVAYHPNFFSNTEALFPFTLLSPTLLDF